MNNLKYLVPGIAQSSYKILRGLSWGYAMPQPDAYRLLQQAKRLPLSDLEHLLESLVAEVEARKDMASDETTTSPIAAGWRQEYRKCGKSTCRCASTDYRHGPYLYRSIWIDGKAKKEYWRSKSSSS